MEKKQFQTLVQDKEIKFKKKKKRMTEKIIQQWYLQACLCLFSREIYWKDEKVQKRKKKLNNVFTCGLIIIIIFRLCHVAVQVTIYIARKLYFILFIGYVSIFHQSLNGRDYFNIIPKGYEPN